MRILPILLLGMTAWGQEYAPDWNDQAMNYARKARETSDYSWYAKAEEAIAKSFAIAPDNYGANKVQVWLWLGRDEYEKALELAAKLKKQVPDDVANYGFMADAQFELGEYDRAVESVQWMLRLRPGNAPALARAGYLREVHGDLDGARQVVQIAYEATPPDQVQDRAALLAQWARLEWLAGRWDEAEGTANRALTLVKEFAPALEVMGQVRVAQKRYAEAVEVFARRYDAARHPENLYALGEAQMKAGQAEKARETFTRLEREALAETGQADNANRELVAYWVDYGHEPGKALALAKREMARRHDVYTTDAYAWALLANGDASAAEAAIKPVLALRVQDPVIRSHAAAIGARLATE